MPLSHLDHHGQVHGADEPRLNTRAMRSSSAYTRAARWQVVSHPVCVECGEGPRKGDPLTCDHIVPLAAGGHLTDPSNLQTLHRSCNSSKGAAGGGVRKSLLTTPPTRPRNFLATEIG